MANLQQCSHCKSEIDISYFGLNRKKQPYKTCVNCRSKVKTPCTQLKRTDTDFVDDITSTATPGAVEDVLGIPPEPIDTKYIIVMDCETNGLIKQRGLNPTQTNLNMCPRIVQFSWGLYTEDGECKEVKDFIIKPDGWTMNGSDRYHGITQERATTEGVDIKNVLTTYKDDIENHCCKLVCHNVDFDKRVVQSEFIRAKLELAEVETCCTMKKGIDYCKLLPKVRGEYKWPSLEQLYRKCFNEDLENAHNSYYDVINCAKCYFKMN